MLEIFKMTYRIISFFQLLLKNFITYVLENYDFFTVYFIIYYNKDKRLKDKKLTSIDYTGF